VGGLVAAAPSWRNHDLVNTGGHPVSKNSPIATFPIDRALGDLLNPEQRAEIERLPFFDHQRDLHQVLLRSRTAHLLAGEPGTGKTLVAIAMGAAVTAAKRNLDVKTPVIYVMPANLIMQIAREHHQFTHHLRVAAVRTGKDPLPSPGTFDVLLISYTLPVASRRIAEVIAALAPFALLVLDESHLLRNIKAKRTRFWINLTRQARWTLLMSGTPMVNSPEDLYTTFYVLDLLDAPGIGRAGIDGNLRPATYNEFCGTFVVYGSMTIGGRAFAKPIGAKNTEVLNSVLAARSTRWLAKELLSLPPVIHSVHHLDIPDVLGELLKGVVEPSPAMLRLRALLARREAGEGIPESDIEAAIAAVSQMELSTYRRVIGTTKAPGVAELIAERLDAGGAPTLVFGHHREALNKIKTELDSAGVTAGLVYGDTPAKERDHLVQSFQNGALDVLVLQIDVAGLGLNLQRAGYVCFGELPWTAAAFDQAVARAVRIGQRQHVLVEIITVPSSLDEAMIRTIRRKAGEAHAVFDQSTQRPAA
jgi:SWI/SNF-related matrix-associated actin-dependent regulator 1 of chromatin subfamily A